MVVECQIQRFYVWQLGAKSDALQSTSIYKPQVMILKECQFDAFQSTNIYKSQNIVSKGCVHREIECEFDASQSTKIYKSQNMTPKGSQMEGFGQGNRIGFTCKDTTVTNLIEPILLRLTRPYVPVALPRWRASISQRKVGRLARQVYLPPRFHFCSTPRNSLQPFGSHNLPT